MKLTIISLLLALAPAVAGSYIGNDPKDQKRELYISNIYLPGGSNTWEECDYTKKVIRSGGGYGHTDFHCDFSSQWYPYDEIVAFHVVPLGAWSHFHNYLSCWQDRDNHYDSMIHCDHEIRRGRAQIHMLCCRGNHDYYAGVAAASKDSVNTTVSSP